MQIHEYNVEVESVLSEALQVAEYGGVAVSDSLLRRIEEQAAHRGTQLNDAQSAQVANIRRTSRINGIERLFEQAEYEAEDGLVIDSDFTTDKIRTYASEVGVLLSTAQEEKIKSIFLRARANAIDELIPEALQAAKQGRIEFVDGTIERILTYAEEAGLVLQEKQKELIAKAFRRVRKETIERALKKGSHPEDRELIQEYANEADIKISKKDKKRIDQN